MHSRRHGGTDVKPGEPMHHMWLRLTIDLDMHHSRCGSRDRRRAVSALRRHHAEFQEADRREDRPGLAARDSRTPRRHPGLHAPGRLLGPLGTTAFQATGRAREARNAGKPLTRKPDQIGSCHVYTEDSPAVRERWPQVLQGHCQLVIASRLRLASHRTPGASTPKMPMLVNARPHAKVL